VNRINTSRKTLLWLAASGLSWLKAGSSKIPISKNFSHHKLYRSNEKCLIVIFKIHITKAASKSDIKTWELKLEKAPNIIDVK